MIHGSLFSGIGGFDLAAEWVGWDNVFQVEWDKYCQKVLKKNFPKTKIYGDIKEFRGEKYRGSKMSEGLRTGIKDMPYTHPNFAELSMGFPKDWTLLETR